MTHLIPEKRMDVNGHMVTRYVLPQTPPTHTVSMPPPNAMSEVEQKYALASSVANDLFTFDGDDMIDANGDVSHEYSFEEAVDALYDMFPNHVLKEISHALQGDPAQRVRQLVWRALEHDVYNFCIDKQMDREEYQVTGKSIQETLDCVSLARFVSDFTSEEVHNSFAMASMHKASLSIQRTCTGAEWDKTLDGSGLRQRLLESEYVVNLLTNSQMERDNELSPQRLMETRLELLNDIDRIKRHQAVLTERGSIDSALLDELDKSESALREGAL